MNKNSCIGDMNAAKELLAEGYIQHNLAYGTGREGKYSSEQLQSKLAECIGKVFPSADKV